MTDPTPAPPAPDSHDSGDWSQHLAETGTADDAAIAAWTVPYVPEG